MIVDDIIKIFNSPLPELPDKTESAPADSFNISESIQSDGHSSLPKGEAGNPAPLYKVQAGLVPHA